MKRDETQTHFFVRANNVFNSSISEVESVFEVENMMNVLIDLINRKVGKSDKRVLTELLTDFMCDDCGK